MSRRTLAQRIGDQFGRPTGRAATVVALILNAVNKPLNRATVDALQLTGGEHVVDLGFGGGIAFPALLRAVGTNGRVTGVERSTELVTRALARGRGRVQVLEGSAEKLPLAENSVNALMTVNTVYFWPDLEPCFAEIARVLSPGGRLAVGLEERIRELHVKAERSTLASTDDILKAMRAAGLVDIARASATKHGDVLTAVAPD